MAQSPLEAEKRTFLELTVQDDVTKSFDVCAVRLI